MQEQINAVQRMQDYIAEHICEKISFAEIAKVSLFSPWYARHLFLEFTGLTPAEYILKLSVKADEYWSYCEEVGWTYGES